MQSPIIEAVMCLDFAGLPLCTQEGLKSIVGKAVPEYRRESDVQSRTLTFDAKASGKVISSAQLWKGFRFKVDNHVLMLSNMDQQIVRFGYSRLRPYESWETFVGEALRVLDNVLSIYHVEPIVKRIGVRFINKLIVSSGSYGLPDLFRTVPSAPRGVANVDVGDFFCRDTSYYEDSKLYATVIKCGRRIEDGRIEVIFDSDVYLNPNLEFGVLGIQGVLGRVRELKNALFWGSVTDAWGLK